MPWVKALFCQEAKTYNTCRIKWSELKTISLSRITPDNLVNNTMVQPSTSRMKIETFLSYSVFDEHSSSWEVICCHAREAEMVRIEAKEIVSGAVWTRGFAVEETSGNRNSQMRTVGLYNFGLCNGEVHSLVVLCLAKWMSWFVLSAHCYWNYSVCVRLLVFSLEISFRGEN